MVVAMTAEEKVTLHADAALPEPTSQVSEAPAG